MPLDARSDDARPHGADPCSRRRFLKRTCAVFAGLGLSAGTFTGAGCDSGGADVVLPPGVLRTGNLLRIDTTRFPDLTRPDGFLLIAAADVILLHDDVLGYRAFSSRCPHEGDNVRQFDGTEMRCPSHDWTFDLDGQPTGRSQRSIPRYALTEDGATLVVTLP